PPLEALAANRPRVGADEARTQFSPVIRAPSVFSRLSPDRPLETLNRINDLTDLDPLWDDVVALSVSLMEPELPFPDQYLNSRRIFNTIAASSFVPKLAKPYLSMELVEDSDDIHTMNYLALLFTAKASRRILLPDAHCHLKTLLLFAFYTTGALCDVLKRGDDEDIRWAVAFGPVLTCLLQTITNLRGDDKVSFYKFLMEHQDLAVDWIQQHQLWKRLPEESTVAVHSGTRYTFISSCTLLLNLVEHPENALNGLSEEERFDKMLHDLSMQCARTTCPKDPMFLSNQPDTLKQYFALLKSCAACRK
ncbi:hypothetical protein HDU93_002535, partial [Gonapodya sp. JEL0774]